MGEKREEKREERIEDRDFHSQFLLAMFVPEP